MTGEAASLLCGIGEQCLGMSVNLLCLIVSKETVVDGEGEKYLSTRLRRPQTREGIRMLLGLDLERGLRYVGVAFVS
jgi:hypothetical protein